MGFNHRLSTAKLIRVEPDGTKVYHKNNKEYRVTEATGPAGFYPPGGRAEMYRGRKDPRTTREFAEGVRERRQRTGVMYRAVKPGPQSL
jgi:hypothetical protein